MPVTNSTYILDVNAQADGRRYVTETHTRSVGAPVIKSYLAAVGADYNAIMLARVPRINAALEDAEFMSIVNGASGASPSEMSKARLAERLRAYLASKSGLELCQTATRILAMIAAGQMTDAEFQSALGVNNPTYNNIKTQMTAMKNNLAAVNSAVSF